MVILSLPGGWGDGLGWREQPPVGGVELAAAILNKVKELWERMAVWRSRASLSQFFAESQRREGAYLPGNHCRRQDAVFAGEEGGGGSWLWKFCSLTDMERLGCRGPGSQPPSRPLLGFPGEAMLEVTWQPVGMGQWPAGRRAPHACPPPPPPLLSPSSPSSSPSPTPSRASWAAILIGSFPLRWFPSHQGAWSWPQGGTLGRGCWWQSRGEPQTIFNSPRLLEACPENMEAARKWLQACEAPARPLARAEALWPVRHQCPVLRASSALPTRTVSSVRSSRMGEGEAGR